MPGLPVAKPAAVHAPHWPAGQAKAAANSAPALSRGLAAAAAGGFGRAAGGGFAGRQRPHRSPSDVPTPDHAIRWRDLALLSVALAALMLPWLG